MSGQALAPAAIVIGSALPDADQGIREIRDGILVCRKHMERSKGCAGGYTGDCSTLHAQNCLTIVAERSGLSVTICSGSRGFWHTSCLLIVLHNLLAKQCTRIGGCFRSLQHSNNGKTHVNSQVFVVQLQ